MQRRIYTQYKVVSFYTGITIIYKHSIENTNNLCSVSMVDPKEGSRWSDTPGKSQVAIGMLRNTGTYHLKKQLDPRGSNCFLREVRTALCEIY